MSLLKGKKEIVKLAVGVFIMGSTLNMDAGEFVIVKDGIPQCEVVVGDNLSPSEKTAVKELNKFIGQMSGAELSVETVNDAEKGKKIIIGKDATAKFYPQVNLSDLGDEGFIIKQEGDDLLIAGGRLRGTMYGVYTLLEDLGCCWPAPSEDVIPQKKTLIVSDMDTRQVPILKQRNIMYAGMDSPWCARNKINRPGWGTISKEYGGTFETAGPQAHDLFLLMKEAGVEVKEDMYCIWNGKRDHTQLCLSDPRVIDAFTKALVKIAKSKPGVPYVQITQEDSKTYCQCERCRKIDAEAFGKPADKLKWNEHSGSMIYCVNKIAKVLAKETPETDLMFAAYLATRKPPTNMKLEKNVIVGLALIESNYMRPLSEGHVEVNRDGAGDLVNWGKLTDKLFVWDYVVNYNHYNMPFPNLDVLVPNVKFYVDHNVRYLMEQAAHTAYNAEFCQLREWVLAKAMWDPEHADNQKLITKFLNVYYGPAAPAIQEYIDAIEKPARTEIFDSSIYDHLNAPYVQADVMAAAEVAMQKADKLAKGNPVYEKRVRHAHLPVWYVIAHRVPGGPTWKAIEKATGKPVDLVAIAKQVKQITKDDPYNKYMAYADHEPFKPWVEWLEDYAAQVAKLGGKPPIPPELKGVDPSTYTLIQACQMDSRSRWWQKSEGASDGWACEVPTAGWTVVDYLSEGEDFVKGKKYEIFARIKPGKKLADSGKGVLMGDFIGKLNAYKPHPDWDVSKIKDGFYQTFKIGETDDPTALWFATNPKPIMDKYWLDCFWLKEVK